MQLEPLRRPFSNQDPLGKLCRPDFNHIAACRVYGDFCACGCTQKVWCVAELMKRMGKTEEERMEGKVFKGSNGQYYFRIVASNGKTIAPSEGYHNRQDAIDTITSISLTQFPIDIEPESQELREEVTPSEAEENQEDAEI